MFDSKLLEKAKEAKSAEELIALANENGAELTIEEAKTYFAQLNAKTGELTDDELDNVAGGGCSGEDGWITETAYVIRDGNGAAGYGKCQRGHNAWRKIGDTTFECIPCQVQGFYESKTVDSTACITVSTISYKP